jgi:rhodanese-related sulfurtransferase
MCGGPGIDLKVSSTIGYERAHQEVLSVVDEDEFVERAVAGLGPQPPNFRAIVAINTGPLARGLAQFDPLTPRQVEQHERDGALVVDVRTELQFDDAHIPGAICITVLRAGFGSRLAWLADHDQPVVVVGRDDEDARRAIGLAGSVGVTNVAGYLAGGMTSWREDQRPVVRIPRMTVPELHARWQDGPPLRVLDVRERDEWERGHIPGTVHVPYHDLRGLPPEIDAGAAVAVICASGQRAAVGASLLARHGAREVIHVVDGGVGTWGRAGWPLDVGG